MREAVAYIFARERGHDFVSPSYDAQELFAPWEYNAAMANVVGTSVYAGATNGVGESYLAFASAGRPRRS